MQKKLSKKQWWIGGLAVILLIGGIVGYGAWQRPRDIGPSLEYIGRVNFGCNWWQSILTFGFCSDRESNHSYFFATDMSEEDVERYFKNAEIVNKASSHEGKDRSIYYTFAHGEQAAAAELYFDVGGLNALYDAHLTTDKPHILRIDAVSYRVLKASY